MILRSFIQLSKALLVELNWINWTPDTPNLQDMQWLVLSIHSSCESTPHIWRERFTLGHVGHILVTQDYCKYQSPPHPYPELIYVMVKKWAKKAYRSSKKKKMAAQMTLSSSLSTQFLLPPKPSLSSPFSCTYILPKTRVHQFKICADLGKRYSLIIVISPFLTVFSQFSLLLFAFVQILSNLRLK